MSYIGDFAVGVTFDTKFTTRQISGAPSTLGSSPVISAYVDNDTTQLTAGITLSVDFDSVTGLNNVRVVATGGNGYAAGKNYQLVITTGTVNSVSVVGEVIAEFSLENRSSLRPTTAGRTLDVSAGGEAGVDWANVGSPTTTVGLSGTTVKAVTDAVTLPASASIAITGNITGNLSGSVGSVTGAVGSVTGNVGGNVTGSIGSLAAQAKTDVNGEVVDALNVDTYAQPGQATPAATTTIRLMLAYLYKAWRNRTTQTATEYDLYNDDATTVDQKASFSDNGTTADRGEVATGP